MIRLGWDTRALTFGYAALAGYVDAIGFLKANGLFVSFMSGNSTRFAVGLVRDGGGVSTALALVTLFLLGVTLNAWIARAVSADLGQLTAALSVGVILTIAACLQHVADGSAVVAVLCIAMGASNAIFRREADVAVGVTYMTGTIVKLGHRLADALHGRPQPDTLAYLVLWLSLVLGGILGAFAQMVVQPAALWIAAGWALSLAPMIDRRRPKSEANQGRTHGERGRGPIA